MFSLFKIFQLTLHLYSFVINVNENNNQPPSNRLLSKYLKQIGFNRNNVNIETTYYFLNKYKIYMYMSGDKVSSLSYILFIINVDFIKQLVLSIEKKFQKDNQNHIPVSFDSVSDLSIISDSQLLYRVTHTGEVEWEQPRMFTTHCRIDITYYPFDTQLCRIKLTSWGYSTDEIELHPTYSEIITGDLEQASFNVLVILFQIIIWLI